MLVSPSHSSLDNVNDRVTLSLYYETSLCQHCASFISNDLVKVFHTDLHTIINLRLVPWGNVEIHCQHGEEECYLNTIHRCVIHFWPDVKEHLEFIRCTEQQSLKGGPVEAQWKNCSEKLRLNEEIINKCYTSGFGYKLLLQYANETAHLKPPQEYVPWVVVNNQPLRQDFENFVKYVCEAYKGDHKPAACKAQSSGLSPTIHALPQPPPIPVVGFYKLALQWPPSVCKSTLNCKKPIPPEFKIHGIWAQDAHDRPVPQYGPGNRCTHPKPMLDRWTLKGLLQSDQVLWVDLPRLWPNLKLGKKYFSFWYEEWIKHGTCSDFAQRPLSYFQSAIQLKKKLSPDMGLTPGSTYTVQQAVNAVFQLIQSYPQISCNRNRTNNRQLLLSEIYVCYERPTSSNLLGTPKNCSHLYHGQCNSLSDIISFPAN
ncbi:hypothetical protein E1A91_A10G251700v1 [Gossypium mustelinum]|uniref:Uncharacterized protein n=2 Tax=Gossypium TaxID=3633 RepID=A0A5J5UBD0_GOSBA|nr:hypothetical protein ES319_A10G251400v1 [Gossypium barbadense]TYJ16414.1 hypothetical protein E1A91_A10G251700v1 [Gossypium mustelinum]